MTRSLPCPVCGGTAHDEIVAVRAMPIAVCQFTRSRAAAFDVERGDLDIVGCRGCGHAFNRVFETERVVYAQGYENSLEFSRRHRAHLESTINSLVNRYDLHGKTILEIGSGSGDFLRSICASGGNRGVGYDPSQPTQPAMPMGDGSVEIVGSAFDDAATSAVDMVCSQHVLEHMPRPIETLRRAREHLVDGGVGYFEVPNGGTIFHDLNIWDLHYEHVSYFSTTSIRRALLEAGFAVRRVETTFGHQYLDAEAVAEVRHEGVPPIAIETFDAFPALFARTMALWRKRLSVWRRTRQKVALWGAGAKAVSFLNMLGVHANEGIDFVVDINPRKCGQYIPGTGQRVIVPGFLRQYQPDWIVVMNPEYQAEIEARLRCLNVGGAIVQSAPAAFRLA